MKTKNAWLEKQPSSPRFKSAWTYHGLLLAVCLLAFILRIAGLADHNIWWDEGIGVWLARMPLLESIRWTAGDVHPPLYYIALHLWWRLAGEGEFVLRFPSVLFSLLTIPLIYRLGTALVPRGKRATAASTTALLAALFLALSRFAVLWAQEIRMYALSALMATGALWAAVELWRPPPPGRRWARVAPWLAYVAFTLGCLYTLYLTITVPMVANLGFLVAWWLACKSGTDAPRKMLGHWLSAQLTVAALFLPWLLYALPQMHTWSSDSAFSPGFFVQLYTTMLAIGTSLNLQAYLGLTSAVFTILFVGLGFIVYNRPNVAQSGALAMLLGGLLLPAIVVAVISLPALSFYYSRPLVPRYLLPLSACFYALLAWGMGTLMAPKAWRQAGTLIGIGVVIIAAGRGLYEFYPGRARRDDYASIAHILNAHRRTEDAVLLYVDRDWPIFVAHYAGLRDDVAYGQPLNVATADALLAPLWATSQGVWLVTTPEALQTDPQQTVPHWLASHATVQHTFITGENALTFYARTPSRAAAIHTLAPGFTPPNAGLVLSNRPVPDAGQLSGAWWPLSRYRTGDTLYLSLYWHPAPRQAYQVALVGQDARHEVAVMPIAGAARQSIPFPLTPDLPGGRYTLQLQHGPTRTNLGDFTLIQSVAGISVAATDIAHPVTYHLGEHITLIGYDLPHTTLPPGGVVELTLYWQTARAIPARYKVFTHLLGTISSGGNRIMNPAMDKRSPLYGRLGR